MLYALQVVYFQYVTAMDETERGFAARNVALPLLSYHKSFNVSILQLYGLLPLKGDESS